MAGELDELVESFRNRPLDRGPYTFCWIDALTQKVRAIQPTDFLFLGSSHATYPTAGLRLNLNTGRQPSGGLCGLITACRLEHGTAPAKDK
jgi:hypothetical protein